MTHILTHAVGGLVATAVLLGALVFQPVLLQAKTYNACGVEYGGRDKKIKEGQALVVRGILKIEKQSGYSFVMLRNDDGSCEVAVVGDAAETEKAVECGDGAQVTIIGKFTSEMFLPAVDPATISCN